MRNERYWARAVAVFIALTLSPMVGWAAEQGPALTVIEPYGPGSVTDRIVDILKPGLEKRTGQPIKIDHAGPDALQHAVAAAPDSGTVLVVDLLSVEVAEATGKPGPKVSNLTPIAKLTGPGSVTLVVPEGSAIKSWADFAAAAKAGSLSIASPGRVSATGVPIALMEKALGIHFTDVAAATRADILDALATKRADAGFLITASLLSAPGAPAPPVRPIVSFGAKRNPQLSNVPTLQESVGKPHNAITSAIALFGPPEMTATQAATIAADFIAAGKGKDAKAAIAASKIPVQIGDALLLHETMSRDAGVIKRVIDQLH
jgi:tripartite-type tricarboxylate transporter receptor subunit TctC